MSTGRRWTCSTVVPGKIRSSSEWRLSCGGLTNRGPPSTFNLVATPDEWRRETARNVRRPSNVSAKGERYREFYQEVIDTLREVHSFTKARKAQPDNWYLYSAGSRQGVQYGTTFDSRGRARVELRIDTTDRDWNERLFDQLEERKGELESEIGETLEWERLGGRRVIAHSGSIVWGSIDDDEETLADIRAWMVERLLKFKQVFGPRLDELVV